MSCENSKVVELKAQRVSKSRMEVRYLSWKKEMYLGTTE